MPRPKKSEVILEEEKPESASSPTSEGLNWKKLLIVAGASVVGLWILLGGNDEKAGEKDAKTGGENPEGRIDASASAGRLQSFLDRSL